MTGDYIAYILSKLLDWRQNLTALNIIKQGALARTSGDTIISNLAEKGLTYRVTNMRHDIRRARSIEFTKTPKSRLRAERWFDNVFEPFRDERDMSSAEATELWRKTVDETWETIEEAEEGEEWWERYKDEF